uniref:PARP-type domain-containing protein n=1 Tax=Zosterops lateralis melanops TaxID=1220523 RepID=A0A8D2PTF8_ZOSLA
MGEQKDIPARRSQAENEPQIIVDVRKGEQHPVPTAGRGEQSLAGASCRACCLSSLKGSIVINSPVAGGRKSWNQPPAQGQGEPWVHSDCCGCVGWGTTTWEQFCKNHPRVTAAHRLSVSQHHHCRGVRKATASAWAGQRGRRKEKQSFPSALGHSLTHTLVGVFHLQSLQGKQGAPWAGQSGKLRLRLAFEAQKATAE